jgi:hypothetical protein
MKQIFLKNKKLWATVDNEYFEFLNKFTWAYSRGYVVTNVRDCVSGKQFQLSLHRLIIGVSDPSVLVDHINHDTLDNRRENLRTATQRQNQQNQLPRLGKVSKYKGVCRNKYKTKWRAQIRTENGRLHLGEYDTEIEAAHVYDEAALKYHGKFAKVNFPKEDIGSAVPMLVEGVTPLEVELGVTNIW